MNECWLVFCCHAMQLNWGGISYDVNEDACVYVCMYVRNYIYLAFWNYSMSKSEDGNFSEDRKLDLKVIFCLLLY